MRWESSNASAPPEMVALTLLYFQQSPKDSEALLPSLQDDQQQHLPIGISPERDPEKAAGGEGGLKGHSC